MKIKIDGKEYKGKEMSREIVYHEIFRDDKLHDRYLDHDYYKTTEEYKKELISNMELNKIC